MWLADGSFVFRFVYIVDVTENRRIEHTLHWIPVYKKTAGICRDFDNGCCFFFKGQPQLRHLLKAARLSKTLRFEVFQRGFAKMRKPQCEGAQRNAAVPSARQDCSVSELFVKRLRQPRARHGSFA